MHSILRSALLFATLLALSACRQAQSTDASSAAGRSAELIDQVADSVPEASTLGEGMTLQGMIEVDLGAGPIRMISTATKMADDLGTRTAERLASKDGQRQLNQAREDVGARVGRERAGAVQASDVQAIADHYAGKTVYMSDVREIRMLKAYQVSLNARAPDGRSADISIRLHSHDLSLMDSRIDYRPDGKRIMESFGSGEGDSTPRLELTRVERTSDGGFSIAGNIEANDLMPGVLAKALQGQRIEHLSAKFDFETLPLRPSGI